MNFNLQDCINDQGYLVNGLEDDEENEVNE